jgi:hypothetical protein
LVNKGALTCNAGDSGGSSGKMKMVPNFILLKLAGGGKEIRICFSIKDFIMFTPDECGSFNAIVTPTTSNFGILYDEVLY